MKKIATLLSAVFLCLTMNATAEPAIGSALPSLSGLLPGDAGTVDAAALDAVLGGSNSVTQALANANITVEGTAAGGDLRFTNADGSNISITEAVTGTVTG
eukprot:gene20974-25701_t